MRSQIAAEFIVLISIGLLGFIVVVIIAGDQVRELYDGREYIITRSKALDIQSELYIAAQVHHGYEREFTIPPKLEGIPITVTTSNGSFYLNSTRYQHYLRIPRNIEGELILGNNYVNNTEGKLYLNPQP
ncbi:MAG: hypothetical protein ABIH34_05895 [Nanoarchaeota archaeon]